MVPMSCDTMVAPGKATKHGQTLFAKNSDRPADECQPLVLRERRAHPSGARTACRFVSLPEAATAWRHVGSRPSWCWGYEHGFNEHQVVIGNEALHSRLESAAEPKLIGMEILRLGLERARTAAEAVEVMADAITRYGQGRFDNDAGIRTYDNSYIVADPREAYVLETAGHQWAVKRVETAVGISNVYTLGTDWDRLSPGAEADAENRGWRQPASGRMNFGDTYSEASRTEGSGAVRRARSCAVLARETGAIDARTMIALLSDHGQDPTEPFHTAIEQPPRICVHSKEDGTGGNTAASLVADLCADGTRLPVYWCSFYSPCLGLFLPVFTEGVLPPVLAVGGPDPDPQSPWWQFHRLSRLARAEPETRVPTVRARWAPLQDRLFQEAYPLAAEARHLLDNNRAQRAEALLTDFMAQTVSKMRKTISDLLTEFQSQPTPVEARA